MPDDESEDVGEKEELEDDMAILEERSLNLRRNYSTLKLRLLTLGKED